MLKILSENLRLILVGVLAILMVAAGAVVLSLYFGGDTARKLVVSDISGMAHIYREGKNMNAGKNSRIYNGDVITTDKNSSLRINIDSDKYIWVEPDSSVYIYFTDVADKGSISVNLTKGSVLCQLNNKLRKNAEFVLKTPNSSVSVRGTVFRAEFDYLQEFMGYKNAMVTQVQNFDGTVSLQLYDAQKQPSELPMVLIERTAAQLITADDVCKYGYLNYSFDLLTLNDITLGELIRARADKELAFTQEELNRAYKILRDERIKSENTEMTEETTSETSAPETTTMTTTETTETTTETEPPVTETEESTSYGSLNTTLQTHEYTTYSGIKWWEITGNTDTGTEGYSDWFDPENDEEYSEETTVPTIDQ